MKDWPDIFRHLTMLSQIGLSLAAPLLICILLCNWLCNRFSMAGWIYLPGFFFGLGGSAATAWKVYLAIMKQENTKRKTDVGFNEHK